MHRSNTRLWTVLAVIGAVVGISALAMAGGAGHHRQAARGSMMAPTGNLTSGQLQQLERIRSNLEQKTLPVERTIEAKRVELEAIMKSPNPDLDRARSLRADIRTLENRLDDAWFDASAQVGKILTPEQRARGAAPSAWLMGNARWYGGWSCPWERAANRDWRSGGHVWNWNDRGGSLRGMHGWNGSHMRGYTAGCW